MFDYSHHQYPFEALSLWGKHPTDPEKICIRYSIKNLDSEKIEAVVWPDAGMYFINLKSKEWKEWIRQFSPPYPVIAGQSRIKAFQNSPQTVRALLPSAPKHATSSSALKYAWSEQSILGLANFDLQQNMPDAVLALSRAGLSPGNVLAIGVGVDVSKPLSLETEFYDGDYSFTHFSSVSPKGNDFVFEEGVKFKKIGSDMQVMLPYALAMESLKERVSSKDVVRFADLIAKYRGSPLKLDGGIFIRRVSVPISKDLHRPSLFIVAHPITVRNAGETMCMSVISYSPIPVEVGANYCETVSRR
jgi:hypothetical protein